MEHTMMKTVYSALAAVAFWRHRELRRRSATAPRPRAPRRLPPLPARFPVARPAKATVKATAHATKVKAKEAAPARDQRERPRKK